MTAAANRKPLRLTRLWIARMLLWIAKTLRL